MRPSSAVNEAMIISEQQSDPFAVPPTAGFYIGDISSFGSPSASGVSR